MTFFRGGGVTEGFDLLILIRTRSCRFLSSTTYIVLGLPLASVLGPLIFLIYVNDVSNKMLSFFILFADDKILYPMCIACFYYNTNHDLYTLEKWFSRWLCKFNPIKTKAIFFNTKSSWELHVPEIFFQHCELKNIWHFGLHLASDLKWSEHINIIVNKAL